MLTDTELGAIQGVLTQILATNGGRVWLQGAYSGPAFMVALSELAGPAESDQQVAAAAIRACVRREWLDDPCWLLILMRRVRAEAGAGGIAVVPGIDVIIDRLVQKINILDEVWYTPWVRNGLPFFDRGPLRETLKDVYSATGRPILRIEGDPDSGKTYSNELLQYVSERMGYSFQVINVEVDEGAEIALNALSLAQIIVGEMGFRNSVADSPLPDPTVHNIPLLQTWILQCARSSGKRWWLFLDGFRRLPEKNTARDLIQGLADKIANGSHRQYLRLILSDYDKPLSRVDEEKIAFDRPERLPDADALAAITECLGRLYVEVGRKPAAGEVEAKSRAVLADIPADQPWIVTIGKRVRATARGIRNGQ